MDFKLIFSPRLERLSACYQVGIEFKFETSEMTIIKKVVLPIQENRREKIYITGT